MDCDHPHQRRCCLTKAAGEGYLPAIHALAMECDNGVGGHLAKPGGCGPFANEPG